MYMGCNCKKKAQTAQKYTQEKTIESLNIFQRIVRILQKIFTLVFILVIFIIVVPLILFQSIIRGFQRKTFKINLSKIIRIFNVK